jgi:hypothetical protein
MATPSEQLELFPEIDLPSDHQIGGDYYKDMAIQPGEFAYVNELKSWEYNVVKRICRHRRGGKGVQDLRKAIHEILLIAEIEYGVDLRGNEEG